MKPNKILPCKSYDPVVFCGPESCVHLAMPHKVSGISLLHKDEETDLLRASYSLIELGGNWTVREMRHSVIGRLLAVPH